MEISFFGKSCGTVLFIHQRGVWKIFISFLQIKRKGLQRDHSQSLICMCSVKLEGYGIMVTNFLLRNPKVMIHWLTDDNRAEEEMAVKGISLDPKFEKGKKA